MVFVFTTILVFSIDSLFAYVSLMFVSDTLKTILPFLILFSKIVYQLFVLLRIIASLKCLLSFQGPQLPIFLLLGLSTPLFVLILFLIKNLSSHLHYVSDRLTLKYDRTVRHNDKVSF